MQVHGEDDVFVVRPTYSSSGVGVSTVKGNDVLIREAVAHARKHARSRTSSVLVSRYVDNLLLFRGRKCHIRAYLLASVVRGTFRSYFWDHSEILAASKPFVFDNFEDKGIHDSHFSSTGGDYWFPADMINT